jgi:hypothetical protein
MRTYTVHDLLAPTEREFGRAKSPRRQYRDSAVKPAEGAKIYNTDLGQSADSMDLYQYIYNTDPGRNPN